MFQKIAAAYDVLKDPASRKEYDNQGWLVRQNLIRYTKGPSFIEIFSKDISVSVLKTNLRFFLVKTIVYFSKVEV